MKEHELWDGSVMCVAAFDVQSSSGSVLGLRQIIQLCWGWPRKAAEMATDYLHKQERDNSVELLVWIEDEKRKRQQSNLMREVPGLIEALCDGLAGRSSRESRRFNEPIDGIEITFTKPISDEGIVTAVLRQVAQRLGWTMDHLRERTIFSSDGLCRMHLVSVDDKNI